MVSLKLMASLAFQCLRYIFLRNYLNIQYQCFLKLNSSFVIKKQKLVSVGSFAVHIVGTHR